MGQELDKRSVSNELLIRYATLSPNEIADKTGFSPLEAAQRISALLASRDWLSDRLEERLLIIQMQDMIQDAQSRLSNASEENYAAIANVVMRGFNSIGARFDSRRKLTEIDINEITAAQARTFGMAFDAALTHIIDGIREMHPDLDLGEVGRLQREGMQKAKTVVEERVVD